tara:strand:+ start:688 stop:873 length:186 start_codon:yes stop_codon:yes gene_type:complete
MSIPSIETLKTVHGFQAAGAKQARKTMLARQALGKSPGGPSKYVKKSGKVKKVKKPTASCK